MINAKAFGLALAANLAAVCAAHAVIIDFDNSPGGAIAPGTNITDQYSSLGVNFQSIENGGGATGVADNTTYSGIYDVSSNIWTNCDAVGCPGNRADILRVTFDSAASNISLQLQSFGGQSVTFNLYDAMDNLLETVMATGDNVFLSFMASGVFRIDGLQPSDSWAWGLDDLTFDLAGASEVPLPAALPLFLAGLAGIGAMRRKRKTA